jgi:hypothetical protein
LGAPVLLRIRAAIAGRVRRYPAHSHKNIKENYMSDHDSEGQITSPRGLPQVRLRRDGEAILVVPQPSAEGAGESFPAFEPFPLPKLPTALSDGCAEMAELVWQGQGRCVGFILLLDCTLHRWGVAVPRQRCSKDSACWHVLREDLPDFGPGEFLGGSFQSRVVAEDGMIDSPPPCDGLHLLQQVLPTHRSIACFLTVGGERRRVDPAEVLTDTWEQMLRRHAQRLTFV